MKQRLMWYRDVAEGMAVGVIEAEDRAIECVSDPR